MKNLVGKYVKVLKDSVLRFGYTNDIKYKVVIEEEDTVCISLPGSCDWWVSKKDIKYTKLTITYE